MLSHVPIAQTATERSIGLLPWIKSWSTSLGNEPELLAPIDWFKRGHDWWGNRTNQDGMWMPGYKAGTFIWDPPPPVARQALAELRQARQKRQMSAHIFVCPRLMEPEWKRHVWKSADLVLWIPAGQKFWPSSMHEPLTLALYLPYPTRRPWTLRPSRMLVEMERQLRRMWHEDSQVSSGNLLHELCVRTRGMDSMPLRELREMLRGQWVAQVSRPAENERGCLGEMDEKSTRE